MIRLILTTVIFTMLTQPAWAFLELDYRGGTGQQVTEIECLEALEKGTVFYEAHNRTWVIFNGTIYQFFPYSRDGVDLKLLCKVPNRRK